MHREMFRGALKPEGALFALTAAALVGTGKGAAAQELIDLDIRVSDYVVEPGESVKVEVWATLTPGPGAQTLWNVPTPPIVGTVEAYQSSIFDLLVTNKAGTWASQAYNPAFHFSYWGTPTPMGVTNIAPHQYGGPPVVKDNPMFLWSVNWTPSDYTPAGVELSIANIKSASAKLFVPGYEYVVDKWTGVPHSINIQVVPAPATAIVGFVGIAVVRSRRRS